MGPVWPEFFSLFFSFCSLPFFSLFLPGWSGSAAFLCRCAICQGFWPRSRARGRWNLGAKRPGGGDGMVSGLGATARWVSAAWVAWLGWAVLCCEAFLLGSAWGVRADGCMQGKVGPSGSQSAVVFLVFGGLRAGGLLTPALGKCSVSLHYCLMLKMDAAYEAPVLDGGAANSSGGLGAELSCPRYQPHRGTCRQGVSEMMLQHARFIHRQREHSMQSR